MNRKLNEKLDEKLDKEIDKEIDKQLEQKRLITYMVFTFTITWAFFFTFILNGVKWGNVEEFQSGVSQLIGLGMLCPTIGMLLTRWVTKEGFAVTGKDSMLLGISFKNKKWVWFLVAAILPWIIRELGIGFALLMEPKAFDSNYPTVLEIDKENLNIIYLQPLMAIISGTMASFAAFGEEAGWRGYMIPKMIKLMGVKKALLFGGIIWGIWHWPLTYIGHNFGLKYWGYPFTGFFAMCLFCIFVGIILSYITYKTESIWSAAICHGIINSSPSILQYFMNRDRITGWKGDSVVQFLAFLVPMVPISILFFMRYNKERKNDARTL